MAEPLTWTELTGTVARLHMTRGEANVLDVALSHELAGRFGELAGSGARAIVLTGRERIFCAGADLERICDGQPAELDEMLAALSGVFLAVFSSPIPVVAAINGHAIAGGCILASACDYRIMNADRGRIGVTGLLAGIPFPAVATEVLRFAVGTQRLREVLYFGRTYRAEAALDLSLVDETAPGPDVLARATEVAAGLAGLAPEPLRVVRHQLRAPALEQIERGRAADEHVRAYWHSAAMREAVTAYASRVLRHGHPG
ncbi:MAG: enoyl-CoA hydratase/isomerase family protein [Streptosporangiaceae bacterium]